MKKFLIIAFCVVCAGALGIWALIAFTPPSDRISKNEDDVPKGGLASPSMNSTPPYVPARTVRTNDVETVPYRQSNHEELLEIKPKKMAPGRIYMASNVQPDPTPEPDLGEYAPSCRILMCHLVDTVDSSSGSDAPVIGLVDEDLIWRGHTIIRKNSEVHGRTTVDKQGERILADGPWILILAEKDCYPGNRELIVKAEALDREDDPAFVEMMSGGKDITTIKKTWGVTDGSKGIRGVVLKSNNGADILNAFVATFIGGIAGVTSQFSQVAGYNNAGTTAGSGVLPAIVVAPASNAIAASMQQYASQIMASIEKDGFYIRILAGKRFKLYIDQDIETGLAKQGAAKGLNAAREDYIQDRKIQEQTTQPRQDREEKPQNQNPMSMVNNEVKGIDALSQKLQQESEILKTQADEQVQLNPAASPTPTP